MRTTPVIFLALVWMQGGCWVRTSTPAPEGALAHIGDVAVVNRELYIHNYLDYTLGRNLEASERNEPNAFGHNSYVQTTLAPGTELDIVGFTSRRLPPGIFYYYVCRVRATKLKFDLPQEMESAVRFETTKADAMAVE